MDVDTAWNHNEKLFIVNFYEYGPQSVTAGESMSLESCKLGERRGRGTFPTGQV